MLGGDELLRMQREQFRHDERNHKDILCLPKPDRLKHYGLHYAKYVGRLARGSAEEKSNEQTLIDVILVTLSAANTLLQDLSKADLSSKHPASDQIDPCAYSRTPWAASLTPVRRSTTLKTIIRSR